MRVEGSGGHNLNPCQTVTLMKSVRRTCIYVPVSVHVRMCMLSCTVLPQEHIFLKASPYLFPVLIVQFNYRVLKFQLK